MHDLAPSSWVGSVPYIDPAYKHDGKLGSINGNVDRDLFHVCTIWVCSPRGQQRHHRQTFERHWCRLKSGVQKIPDGHGATDGSLDGTPNNSFWKASSGPGRRVGVERVRHEFSPAGSRVFVDDAVAGGLVFGLLQEQVAVAAFFRAAPMQGLPNRLVVLRTCLL